MDTLETVSTKYILSYSLCMVVSYILTGAIWNTSTGFGDLHTTVDAVNVMTKHLIDFDGNKALRPLDAMYLNLNQN